MDSSVGENLIVEQSIPVSKTFALPVFFKDGMNLRYIVPMYVYAIAVYLTTNHFPSKPPVLLPMLWIDNVIPFIPETVWFYMSEYVFFLFVVMASRNSLSLNKYFYAYLALWSSAVLFFLGFPTTYPRDLFPLPESLDPITYYAFSQLRITDTPTNCLPSLHVAAVYLSSMIFLNQSRWKFVFFFSWATVVAISTLTSKQHYFVDVLSGFILAALFYWVFYFKVPYRTWGGAQANR